ncbi:MAG: hypothetical protein AAB966_01025, partial [Patescibacteria group bacterium]
VHDPSIPISGTIIKYREGTTIRVFRTNGKTYFSTYRRLRMTKSKWCDSQFFDKIYSSLDGPKEEELFDLTKPDSPWTHYFLLHTPELLLTSREELLKGYIMYYGFRKPKFSPFLDVQLKVPKYSTEEPFDGSAFLHFPIFLSGEEALFELSNNLPLFIRSSSTKLVTEHYNFLTGIRGGTYDIQYRLYQLLDVRTSTPVFMPCELTTLPQEIPVVTDLTLKTRAELTDNTIRAYYMSVPLCLRRKVVFEMTQLREDREKVIQSLIENFNNSTSPQSSRANKILAIASSVGDKNMIRRNIRNLVMKEFGVSLFHLVQLMKKNEL